MIETTKINPVEIETKIVDAQGNELVPVRHGHWIKERNPMRYHTIPYVWVCDQCGTAFYYNAPYCGECGAKMDGAVNSPSPNPNPNEKSGRDTEE